jgi:hypothetical protein
VVIERGTWARIAFYGGPDARRAFDRVRRDGARLIRVFGMVFVASGQLGDHRAWAGHLMPSGPLATRMVSTAAEHTTSTPATIVDMKKAPIQPVSAGQSLDQLCAARDSNLEPAD